MQPESSGCNEVKYNLNVDTIEAIFKTYPAGKELDKYSLNISVLQAVIILVTMASLKNFGG